MSKNEIEELEDSLEEPKSAGQDVINTSKTHTLTPSSSPAPTQEMAWKYYGGWLLSIFEAALIIGLIVWG